MSAKRMKSSCIFLTKIVISIILLWVLIHSAQIKMDLLISLFHQPFLLMQVISLFVLIIFFGSWRWQQLNSAQDIHLSYYKTWIATYLGGAFNNVMPGALGGDLVRLLYVFKKEPNKKSVAFLTLFSDRVMGFVAVCLTLTVVCITHIHTFTRQSNIYYLISICALFCISVISALLFCLWLSKQTYFIKVLHKIMHNKNWAKPILSFFHTLSLFSFKKKVLIKCIMVSVLIQLFIVSIIKLLSIIMGLPSTAFSHFVIAMGVAQVVNLLPITPGGIGVGEMAFANVLLILNPNVTAAYATVFFAYRIISVLTYLPGVICYIPKFIFTKQSDKTIEVSDAELDKT